MYKHQKNHSKLMFREPGDARAVDQTKQSKNDSWLLTLMSLSLVTLLVLLSSTAIAQDPSSETNTTSDSLGTEILEQNTAEQANSDPSAVDSLLGTTKVTESRRENGQRYRIELDHSGGGKQYIEENDSDGRIESTANDIEDTPNLPKWKLGSW